MFETCLRLTCLLNQMAAGLLSAPEVEHRLTAEGPHHVSDPEGLLGLNPIEASPLRLALSRVAHGAVGARPQWLLLAPVPGHLSGLRGPAEFNRAALEAGGAVVLHAHGTPWPPIAWVGLAVGPAVQWRLWRAEQALPPEHPSEAARAFTRLVIEAAQGLGALDATTGQRPDEVHPPVLGDAYPAVNQALLDRAWTVWSGAEAGLAGQDQLLSSHLVTNRERHLRELAGAARGAVCSAVSWPRPATAGRGPGDE